MKRPAPRASTPSLVPNSRFLLSKFLFAVFVTLGMAGAAQAQVISDDFRGGTLKPIWTFVNPLADESSFTMTGSQVDITAAAGAVHDAYSSATGNTLPRIKQTAIGNPLNFQVVVKFESDLPDVTAGQFRTQGILLEEQAATDFVRIEFLRLLPGQISVFVSTNTAGTGSTKQNLDITVTPPMYLRVSRTGVTGDNFTVEWSADDITYNPVVSFSHTITVNDISIYAGSSALVSHTARADFFFETASPIFPEDCGNNFVEDLEQCDEGDGINGTAGSCCSVTCDFVSAGAICNAGSGDLCDPDETCTGIAAACPNDAITPAATVCRTGSGDLCDPDETCTGVARAACPANFVQPASFTCRGSAGICDVAETCTGVAEQTCPGNGFIGAGTVCRGTEGVCDAAEVCSGESAACPNDGYQSAGTVCRLGSGDLCDPDETCTGIAAACPNDAITPAATVCRTGSGDLCDPDEVCSGTAGVACPADTVASATTVCNAGSGDLCDPDEFCSGTAGVACPADIVAAGGTVCNAGSGDLCDPDEVCSGAADVACPADTVASATTVCNVGSGDLCDPDELCSGTADVACPADVIAVANTVCRGAADDCDVAEVCDGVGSNCPADAFAGAGTICSSGDECLMEEHCDAGGLCIGGRLSVPAPNSCPVIDNSLYFTDAVQDVVVDRDLVYVAARSAGLRIVDNSDPDFPAEVASYDPATCMDSGNPVPFEALDVVRSGANLFVSAGACGVLVFDARSPLTINNNTIPRAIDTAGDAFDVRSIGGLAYVADFDGGLAVLDLMTGMQVDSFGAGTSVTGAVDIELDGNRSFVATGAGLRIVDDDPQTGLLLAGMYDPLNDPTGASQDAQIVRDGVKHLIYLARMFDGLDVLDVTDPSNVIFKTNLPSGSGSYAVSISGSRAVTAEGDGGIRVLDLADLSSPISLGLFPSEGFTADVEMNDRFAFVAFDTNNGVDQGGLRIVQLEKIGVDPSLVPEPATVLGSLAALTTIVVLARRRRNERR